LCALKLGHKLLCALKLGHKLCNHALLRCADLPHAGAALAVALPLTVDAVVIFLAIILAGCVVVSIADSFAAHEVDTRLRISGAVGIFTQVCVMGVPQLVGMHSVTDHCASPLVWGVHASAGQ
jgi:acyl-coenzyme A synthetase/AMP-(fatty) acid ligase